MENDDWKKLLPFRRHWLTYLFFKLLVLALALLFVWQMMHVFEVI
jgi:hypothetical protein